MQQEDVFIQVHDKESVADCLNILMQHSGASLLLSKPDSTPLPVVVMADEPGSNLSLDISAIREVTSDLKHGMEFRLLGQLGGTAVRSRPLTVISCEELEGRMRCECAYPESFEVAQRRKTFRVELRSGWCSVLVSGTGTTASKGELRNLSPEGCMVALPLTAAGLLAGETGNLRLELKFASGARLALLGTVSRQQLVTEQRILLVGFQFPELSTEQNRTLWSHIHEIERESTRVATLSPSPLPTKSFSNAEQMDMPAKGTLFPTPTARSLASIAEFLDTQIIALRIGDDIDSGQLSRHSESLLALLDQGRESLLFALHCLIDEPEVVRHSLAVAVRMADITSAAMPRDMGKAIIASAMVHDLGKALNATALLQDQLDLLVTRLKECRWLAPEIIRQVIEQANERLDGSGYPNGMRQPELRELARLMAVVKTIDAMGRHSSAGPAQAIDVIYRHLLTRPEQFDQNWVKRYIRHFGVIPVGTLVRYEGGEMAWVRSLNEKMQPSQVQLAREAAPPRVATLGEVLQGGALDELGKIGKILVL